MNYKDANTFIGEGTKAEGKFLINGTLFINGRFEGEILKVDNIHIGVSGRVKANLIASALIIEGVVIGNIVASTRVMLMPTARVLGDIRTPELIIQNGVILEGKFIISNDPTKSIKDEILKAYEK